MSKRFVFLGAFLLGICNLQGIESDPILDTSFVEDPVNGLLPQEEGYETCYFSVITPDHHHKIISSIRVRDCVLVYTEDKACWKVNEAHSYIVKHWDYDDTIFITQNRTCCSKPKYPYKMINQNDLSEIEVELQQGPEYNGNYTRWISGLRIPGGEGNAIIILDNGKRLTVSSDEKLKLENRGDWDLQDTVIVAVNSPFWTAFDPCSCLFPKCLFDGEEKKLLINVDTRKLLIVGESTVVSDIENNIESFQF